MNLKKQQKALVKSQEVDGDKLHELMMGRCIPIAKKVLKIIADNNLDVGTHLIARNEMGEAVAMDKNSRPDEYRQAASEILNLMLEANLLWAERELVFMLVKQPMDMLQNIVIDDSNTSKQHGECQLLGIEVMGERSFQMLDEFTKKAKSLGKIMRSKTVEELEVLANANPVGAS